MYILSPQQACKVPLTAAEWEINTLREERFLLKTESSNWHQTPFPNFEVNLEVHPQAKQLRCFERRKVGLDRMSKNCQSGSAFPYLGPPEKIQVPR